MVWTSRARHDLGVQTWCGMVRHNSLRSGPMVDLGSRAYCLRRYMLLKPVTVNSEKTVKPLQAPRVGLIFYGLGTILWVWLGIIEVTSGAHLWRVIAYALLTAASVFMFIWALWTVRSKARRKGA